MSKTYRVSIVIASIIILLGGVVCVVVFGMLNTTTPPAQAITLNSSTTYYTDGSSFYTLSNTVTHYRCTNSQHSGTNDYTSTSQESGTCYTSYNVICPTCDGSGTRLQVTATTCRICGGSGVYNGSNCGTCNGSGIIQQTAIVTCSTCGGDGRANVNSPHNFSVNYRVYTYQNIDTNGTTTSQSAFTRATGYTVTFNNNGGSGTMSSQYFLHGHSQAIKANTFTRENYTFLGWGTSNTATSPAYTDGQAVTQITSGSSVTLYAVWESNIKITTTTGGSEIVSQIEENNDILYSYALEFEDGKYLNYMLINEKQVNIGYATGAITDVPECLGIEYMTNSNASQLYLEVRNLTGTITITLNLVTVEPSLVPASSGTNINGVAVQATYGGSATVLGDNIDEMADIDTIILSAKIASVGYRFVGWYDVATNQLLSEEMSARLPLSTVKNKLIEARFEPILQNGVNDETDNNFDEFA